METKNTRRYWSIKFASKFDKVQEQLEVLGNSDDLLAGMSTINVHVCSIPTS